MGNALSKLWDTIRHVLAVRSLLDWIGWKESVGVALVAIVVGVWSHVEGVPGPILFVLALTAAAIVIIIWRALSTETKPAGPAGETPAVLPNKRGRAPGLVFAGCIALVLAYLAGRPVWVQHKQPIQGTREPKSPEFVFHFP